MPHKIHYPILFQLGLSQSEAQIYEILLELGPKTAQELIEPSGLSRGNVYNILTSLKDKELVFEEKDKKTIYRAVNPEILRALAKAKLNSAQHLLRQLETTMPDLKSQYQLITKTPTFRVFEGVDGLKKVYQEMLTTGEPIYSLVGPPAKETKLVRWLRRTYLKERLKKQIPVYAVISSESSIAEEMIATGKAELRTAVNIEDKKYPFSGDISIFDSNIAFIDHEEMIAVIIESPALAKTVRSTIKALMNLARPELQIPESVIPNQLDQQKID